MSSQEGGPLGYESAVVNGLLVNVAPKAAYQPWVMGPAYFGPSAWPRQGVYQVPPVVSASGAGETDMFSGGGTQTFPSATSEKGNPFHLTKSPLIFAILFLVFSLFMLHKVHYA